jgi:hypothetical protein
MHKTSKTRDSWPGTALAHAKCIERVLDHLGTVIVDKHGRTPTLERRNAEQTARNTCDVEYLVRSHRKRQLSLRFIVTGENADLVLFESREAPNQADCKGHPAEIDQHVYHLEDIDHLKEAVERKIVSHLHS